ncbi:MAG: gliding motility-associated C-terminal domain-containing protein [Saprospiraceae bacterium]
MNTMFKISLIFSCLIYSTQLIYSQAIKNIENLTSITFYEKTGKTISHTFDVDGEELNTRFSGKLNYANFDFQGWPGYEFFDVYYSNGDGSFNKEGKFVSIEARFDISYQGGGGNIMEVEFKFNNGYSIFASHLESFQINGANYYPQSELKAVDCNLDTWSTLGNTREKNQKLRLTLGIQNSYKEIKYVGCRNDSYSVEVNGTIYNEGNPSGMEKMKSKSGCDSLIFIQLRFEDCGANNEECVYYIPNGFSPNGDGCHDFFSIMVADDCEIKNFKIRIYNRWGDEVYKSNKIDFQWNGTSKGNKMTDKIFIWQVEYTTVTTGNKQTKKGKVRILN